MDKIIQASRVDKAGKYVEALALIEKDDKYFNLLDQEVPIDETVVLIHYLCRFIRLFGILRKSLERGTFS
ncbi:hypothetical protein ERIC1_3c01350 [Paenibacillus larvae subsp. larvae DSM 25719]|uniref:hypothetical protein n=1 Tax=Paenibacillus larvae TaxID=1464 RepID=UPI0003DBD765|nr:hypothetical protein [Paenibacillus larvae]ETK25812.1 hypothetical protein ERIC1_3c01350 [Paenibacillus larvae subsp. larvae DSM 25719]